MFELITQQREGLSGLLSELEMVKDQRDALLAALKLAKDVLDNVQGDVNPERGYADELEADVSSALVAVTAAIVAAKLGPTVSVPAELVGGV